MVLQPDGEYKVEYSSRFTGKSFASIFFPQKIVRYIFQSCTKLLLICNLKDLLFRVFKLVVAVLRDRLLLLSLLVERFLLTLINEDYFYYYFMC